MWLSCIKLLSMDLWVWFVAMHQNMVWTAVFNRWPPILVGAVEAGLDWWPTARLCACLRNRVLCQTSLTYHNPTRSVNSIVGFYEDACHDRGRDYSIRTVHGVGCIICLVNRVNNGCRREGSHGNTDDFRQLLLLLRTELDWFIKIYQLLLT